MTKHTQHVLCRGQGDSDWERTVDSIVRSDAVLPGKGLGLTSESKVGKTPNVFYLYPWGFPGGASRKELHAIAGDVRDVGPGDRALSQRGLFSDVKI